MTCREMLMQERPELVRPDRAGGCAGCPSDYGYLYDPDDDKCGGNINCTKCWDREIPGTLPMRYKIDTEAVAELAKPEPQYTKENPHITPAAEKAIKKVAEAAMQAAKSANIVTKTIKDSGDRTQFSTGAVRDMREGKGRCDLMPLEVVCHMFTDNPYDEEPIIHSIEDFQSTENTDYLYDAIVNFCNKQYHGFVPTMLLEVAKHFEEGAKKYGENNWQKGIPVHCYIDSAIRHYLKWLRGDEDEPHDRAFVWNIMCCIWEVDYHKEAEK